MVNRYIIRNKTLLRVDVDPETKIETLTEVVTFKETDNIFLEIRKHIEKDENPNFNSQL